MKEETVQRVVAAMVQMRDALFQWVEQMDMPKEELMAQYDALVREDGEGAKMLRVFASMVVPLADQGELKTTKEIFDQFNPEKYAEFLRPQPEPDPVQVEVMVGLMKNILPSVRQKFLSDAKKMPRYRHGGRPKELETPEERQGVREEIKKLREPGVKLQDLYRRLAQKHKVSPTTIKRIWLEKGAPNS